MLVSGKLIVVRLVNAHFGVQQNAGPRESSSSESVCVVSSLSQVSGCKVKATAAGAETVSKKNGAVFRNHSVTEFYLKK